MYSYELLKDDNKILVRENGDIILELSILFHNNNAWLDMITISDKKKEELSKASMIMSNYFAFMSVVIKDIKSELTKNGINIENVLLGSFSEIKELDNLAAEIDEDIIRQATSIRLASKR